MSTPRGDVQKLPLARAHSVNLLIFSFKRAR